VRGTRPAHAPIGDMVGGYMREGGKKAAREKRTGLRSVGNSVL
jgi:hypothetical protein